MFTYKTIPFTHSTIYLLYYPFYPLNDFVHLLNEQERQHFDSFCSLKRKYEYLSTRILRHKFLPDYSIKYRESGEPFMDGQKSISISHCLHYSAIACSQHQKIGIDLEPITNKAQTVYHKFLNPQECRILNTQDPVLMTRAWSCKEVLFKLSQRKGVIFKEDLLIKSYENGVFDCSIYTANKFVSVYLTSKIVDNIILTSNDIYG